MDANLYRNELIKFPEILQLLNMTSVDLWRSDLGQKVPLPLGHSHQIPGLIAQIHAPSPQHPWLTRLSLLFMFCYPLTRALALVFSTLASSHTLAWLTYFTIE